MDGAQKYQHSSYNPFLYHLEAQASAFIACSMAQSLPSTEFEGPSALVWYYEDKTNIIMKPISDIL
jgi:hypothetical protein